MTVVCGAALAAGLLLVMAPWVWPPRPPVAVVRPPGPIARLFADAGFAHASPRIPVLAAVIGAAVGAAVAWLVAPLAAVALVASALGAATPFLWLRARKSSLLRRRRGLWPDVCELLIASVRAGMALPDAVASLADSAPAPLRPALRGFAGDLAASGHFDSAMERLKATLADPVADRIIETLRMARQVGGTELVPVIRALAASVRADATLRAEVEARQSWTRGAALLGVIAPWAILALLAMRPEGAEAYGSPGGVALVLGGAAVSIVAFRLMVRIGRLPEPRRWFG